MNKRKILFIVLTVLLSKTYSQEETLITKAQVLAKVSENNTSLKISE